MAHAPVLFHEVLRLLDPHPGEFVIDGTADGGGHAAELIARVGPGGKFLGVDWDEGMVKTLRERFRAITHARFTGGNFADLAAILVREGLPKANGLLLDLGFSSDQLESSGRGFSFMRDEPLLMTYDSTRIPAYAMLRQMKEHDLAECLRVYGEERYAGRIARAIKITMKKQPITTSGALRDVITRAVPQGYERGRLHPATRTFQALRIVVNGELENLRAILASLPRVMAHGGRTVVISFHSLEDRIVKNSFRQVARDGFGALLTPKPVRASEEEVRMNSRSRSAKLRAIIWHAS